VTTPFFTAAVGNSSTPTLSAASAIGDIIFNSGAASFNIGGAFALTINANGTTAGEGLNNAAGTTETISVSSLLLGANQTWNNAGSLTLSSATFGIGTSALTVNGAGTIHIGANQTWTATTGSSTLSGGTLDLGTHSLTVNGGTTTISDNITGTGGSFTLGSGAATLGGINTYTGGTTLNGGSLTANSSTALGTGPIALNAGNFNLTAGVSAAASAIGMGPANLNVNTTGNSTFGDLTVTGSGSINLNSTGNLNFANANQTGGLLTINGWQGPAFDPNQVSTGANSGTSAIFVLNQPTASFLANVQFSGAGGYPQGAQWVNTVNGPGELVPVPEPQVYAALFGLGLLGFAVARRRLFASA